ncbi:MAG: aminofutalosine synthase MqnE [Thermodesulfobacteriota bacterium]|nr:aminofutalosine synthase MqnE [Thermodesulfobacteriota bacterium]
MGFNMNMDRSKREPWWQEIRGKVEAGERLSFEDGLRLYQSNDILAIGALANTVRRRLNGDKAFYIYNQHINYSNICVNRCRFCAFGKDKGDPAAYEMSTEEIVGKIQRRRHEPITEVHIVGGIHPDLPYRYYVEMIREIKKARPEIHIHAFTAVEIAHLAKISGQTISDTLCDLRGTGLGSLPGGGAEVFSPRIRERLCPKKLSPEGWLEVAKTAHRLGIKSNATMLYGHIESAEERVGHLLALRRTQDETGGFMSFIPLAFHPRNTELSDLSNTTGFNDLKNIAVARLLLDNFPHIKAYWVMIGPKLAQIALNFGADDLDGTIIEEKITHMAGAETAQGMTRAELRRLIHEAGCTPVERDTLYNIVEAQP